MSNCSLMASESEATCESDPNFAVICAFLEKFGASCGITSVDFLELQRMLENSQEVSEELVNLHIKLLRKARKSVAVERWERALVNICHTFSSKDAWEIERFGYKNARLSTKIRALKELLEMQFDYNGKFKTEINKKSADDLRSQPLGRDKLGHTYWFMNDNNYQIRIYKEDPDEETWQLIAKNRTELMSLLSELNGGDLKINSDSNCNEDDSNSILEKPVTDTGQAESNSPSATNKDHSCISNEESSLKLIKSAEKLEIDEGEGIKPNITENDTVKRPILRIKTLSELMESGKNLFMSEEEDNVGNEQVSKKRKIHSLKKTTMNSAVVEDTMVLPTIVNKGESTVKESCDSNLSNQSECGETDIILSEEIEEPVMYIKGEGSGNECTTGNEKRTEKGEENEAEEICEDAKTTDPVLEKSEAVDNVESINTKVIENTSEISSDVNCDAKEVQASDSVVLDTVSDTISNSEISMETSSKMSKLDEETLEEKNEVLDDSLEVIDKPNSSSKTKLNEGSIEETSPNSSSTNCNVPVKTHFYFGPGCLTFKQNSNSTSHGQLKDEIMESSSIVKDDHMREMPTKRQETNKLEKVFEEIEKVEEVKDDSANITITVAGQPDEFTKTDEEEVVNNKTSNDKEKDEIAINHKDINKCIGSVDVSKEKEADLLKSSGANLLKEREVDQSKSETKLILNASQESKVADSSDDQGNSINRTNNEISEQTEHRKETSEPTSALSLSSNTDDLNNYEKNEGMQHDERAPGNVEPLPTCDKSIVERELIDSHNVVQNEKSSIENISKVNSDENFPETSPPDNSSKVSPAKTSSEASSAENSSEISPAKISSEASSAETSSEVTPAENSSRVSSTKQSSEAGSVESTSEVNSADSNKLKITVSSKDNETKKKILRDKRKGNEGSANKKSEGLSQEKLCTKSTKSDQANSGNSNIECSGENKQVNENVTRKQATTKAESNGLVETDVNNSKMSIETIATKATDKSVTKLCPKSTSHEVQLKNLKEISIIVKKMPSTRQRTFKINQDEPEMEQTCKNIELDSSLAHQSPRSELKITKPLKWPVKKVVKKAVEPKKTTPNKNLKNTSRIDSTLTTSATRNTRQTRSTTRVSTIPESAQNEKKQKKNINLKAKVDKISNEFLEKKTEPLSMNSIQSIALEDIDSNSNSIIEIHEKDPLASSAEEEEEKINSKDGEFKSLSNFSFDYQPSEAIPQLPVIISRVLRKRGRENIEIVDEVSGKKPKMKNKSVDVIIRKSVEEKCLQMCSSDDNESNETAEPKVSKKTYNFSKNKKRRPLKIKTLSVAAEGDDESPEDAIARAEKKRKEKENRSKRLLLNLGVTEEEANKIDESMGVRQSRRIAQIKIKEDATGKKVDEILESPEKKKYKKKDEKISKEKEKKKSYTKKLDTKPLVEVVEKKLLKKKSKHKKKFHGWKSSSDSHSSNEASECTEFSEEEPFEEPLIQLKSDHEFSPESELEDQEVLPMKRARTVRKEADEEVEEFPCQKCGKSDHPECILLCDKCDNGWHCSCLRPPFFVIPEGDWFCPVCQHDSLVTSLQQKLEDYDKLLLRKEMEDRRKERLAYVGISLNNVLPTKDKHKKLSQPLGESSSSDESISESESESSDSDEPIYQLRQRKQAHSYKFTDYDDLINSAIQDEVEIKSGNIGRGKDMLTIVEAAKEEEAKADELTNHQLEDYIPPVVPKHPDLNDPEHENIGDSRSKKKRVGRRKHRKLNSLDVNSEDDADSDEDFKGSSSDEEEEDFNEDNDSDDSIYGSRRNAEPVRRSTRARVSRYDTDFLNDNSDDDAPKRKKKKPIWDDSESEESEGISWGNRKRTQKLHKKVKKSSKKKKTHGDSDLDSYRKKKPRIKYGGLDDSDEDVGRKTRGKKTSYLDTLGSDSEEENKRRKISGKFGSDEEYVADEDNEKDSAEEEISEEKNDSSEDDVPLQIPKLKIRVRNVIDDDDDDDECPEAPVEVANNMESPKSDTTDIITKPPETETPKVEDSNPLRELNKNLEEMDDSEVGKMMEEEEYANKQLQLVAIQIEKEKKRKEAENKILELNANKKEDVEEDKPLNLRESDLCKEITIEKISKEIKKVSKGFLSIKPQDEPFLGNVSSLIVNDEDNDELSEPPGVSLPLFSELNPCAANNVPLLKKRKGRGKGKKTLAAEAASGRAFGESALKVPENINRELLSRVNIDPGSINNMEIAAPPQPFSQSQPTPSVITRMLQNSAEKSTYPVGRIRPKQFAMMTSRDSECELPNKTTPRPMSHETFSSNHIGRLRASPHSLLPGNIELPKGITLHRVRNPPPQEMCNYEPKRSLDQSPSSHRSLDPSPSGGGTVNIPHPPVLIKPVADGKSCTKLETDGPVLYSGTSVARVPPGTSLKAIPSNFAPDYNYPPYPLQRSLPANEDPVAVSTYNLQCSEQYDNEVLASSDNSNNKSYDEEAGGEFGGLVSYFSSQHEDNLDS